MVKKGQTKIRLLNKIYTAAKCFQFVNIFVLFFLLLMHYSCSNIFILVSTDVYLHTALLSDTPSSMFSCISPNKATSTHCSRSGTPCGIGYSITSSYSYLV